MALESVFYDEEQGYQLINMLLEQEEEKQDVDVEQKEDKEGNVEDDKNNGNIEEVVRTSFLLSIIDFFVFRRNKSLLLMLMMSWILKLKNLKRQNELFFNMILFIPHNMFITILQVINKY